MSETRILNILNQGAANIYAQRMQAQQITESLLSAISASRASAPQSPGSLSAPVDPRIANLNRKTAQLTNHTLAQTNPAAAHSGRLMGNGWGGIIYPIKGVKSISDAYGPRINPVTGRPSFHTGEDFPASMGTPIRAVASGVVRATNPMDSIYGNQVILGHGKGRQTMYGHMENYIVSPGEYVKQGQIIGYVGSTGLSTGPHLHFETWNHQNPFNPMTVLGG